MGVITVTDIDYGQIFGPFPSYLIATDPAYVIGLLTNDKPPEGVVLRVDTSDQRERTNAVDWLPYVSSARDEEEQNVEAYLKEGSIFYRTLRILKAGEELLVWYSKDFSHILGVPELQTNSKRDDEEFICSHCGEMFEFPYPLRAHLKFKCSFTREEGGILPKHAKEVHSTFVRPPSDAHALRHFKDMNGDKSKRIIQVSEAIENLKKNSNNNTPFTISQNVRKRRMDESSDLEGAPICKVPGISNTISSSFSSLSSFSSSSSPKEEFKIHVSHSIEKLSKSYVPKQEQESSPIRCEEALDIHSENLSAFRKVEKSPTLSDGNSSCSPPGLTSHRSPHRTPLQRYSPSFPAIPTPSSLNGPSSLLAIHPTPNLISRSNSTSSTMDDQPSTSSSMINLSRSPMKAMGKSMGPSAVTSLTESPLPVPPSLMGMSMYMPRLPPMMHQPGALGMPRPGFLSPPMCTTTTTSGRGVGGGVGGGGGGGGGGLQLPHSAFPDQIPPGLLEICRATIPTVGPLTESFAANIRKMDIHDTISKRALFADRHISSLGFLKSTNPMVGKLLQTTNPTMLSSPINALNLSQNWCAKCNATFRMTSDLVYHMRSHHKREFDPMKRKREEKLKCNICNETFRERHHLTRHMSSHA